MPRIYAEYRDTAKKKIIEAAIGIATNEGWDAVTMEKIARRVGVTRAALYSYFENGETLKQEVIFEMNRRFQDQLMVSLERENDIHTTIDRVSDLMFLNTKSCIPVVTPAIAGISQDSEFYEKISRTFDQDRSHIVAVLARFQDMKQIPEDADLPSAVQAIFAMTMGFGIMPGLLQKDSQLVTDTWKAGVGRILQIGNPVADHISGSNVRS
jgi:AcrR family transcriptional regulator